MRALAAAMSAIAISSALCSCSQETPAKEASQDFDRPVSDVMLMEGSASEDDGDSAAFDAGGRHYVVEFGASEALAEYMEGGDDGDR